MRLEQVPHGSGAFRRATEEARISGVRYEQTTLHESVGELLLLAGPLGRTVARGEHEHTDFDGLQVHFTRVLLHGLLMLRTSTVLLPEKSEGEDTWAQLVSQSLEARLKGLPRLRLVFLE